MLSGARSRLVVQTEGMSFDSMLFPQGVEIIVGGSPAVKKCTSTDQSIEVIGHGTSLMMEDSRVFGSAGDGVYCLGKFNAMRCTLEDNRDCGVWLYGQDSSVELMDCVIRNNAQNGVHVNHGKAMLRSGRISENQDCGVVALSGAKITVASAEEDKPQTVCKDNMGSNWVTEAGGRIIGIPQEKINVRNEGPVC